MPTKADFFLAFTIGVSLRCDEVGILEFSTCLVHFVTGLGVHNFTLISSANAFLRAGAEKLHVRVNFLHIV
jgi:hypothetical protein